MEKPCFVLGIASFLCFKPIINFESCDVKMNIRMRARIFFKNLFLVVNHFVIKLSQLIDTVMNQILR